MLPTSFTVENYRAFARPATIEIKPITLIYGHNSAGKSALVRFLPLIAESIRAEAAPIRLDGEVVRDAGWSDLVCRNKPAGPLRFELGWLTDRQEAFRAEYRIRIDQSRQTQWVDEIRLVAPGDRRIQLKAIDPAGSRFQDRSSSLVLDLPMLSLVPEQNPPHPWELWKSLDGVRGAVQWISGLRQRHPRRMAFTGTPPRSLSHDGENVGLHLAYADRLEERRPLLDLVSSFFRKLAHRLVIGAPGPGLFDLRLSPSEAPTTEINLLDTGEGFSQVLPCVVALSRARLDGPRLVALEQPELHLHTRAQQVLAEFICETARDRRQPQMVIETHSEVLLTAIQLAVAKGFPSELVRIYWVHAWPDGTSTVDPVDLDTEGRPMQNWPPNAFGEILDLAGELTRLRLKRRLQ